jgi:hypothetical protein
LFRRIASDCRIFWAVIHHPRIRLAEPVIFPPVAVEGKYAASHLCESGECLVHT